MICDNCHQREGTEEWTGDTYSAFEMAHGFRGNLWCSLCVARAQLAYAQRMAARVETLTTVVRALEAEEKVPAQLATALLDYGGGSD